MNAWFDVVLLSTSIPLELARETIIHLLDDFDLCLPPYEKTTRLTPDHPVAGFLTLPSVTT